MARLSLGIIAVCSWLFFTCLVYAETIDITTLGAKPGADIGQPLADAWKKACASPTPAKIVIPKGEFLLKQAKLQGPCTSPIEIQVGGTIKAPVDPSQMNMKEEWIMIMYVNHLTMSGGGTFDGQGTKAWTQNDCTRKTDCSKLPNNFSFNFVNNSIIHDLTSLNSKLFHVNVFGCNNVTFQHFTVTTPGNSPNTDGIHIGHSNDIKITECTIGTGDDCISIGDGATQIHITKVTCGPGHGISVGSLGRYGGELPVEGIFVKDCTIMNTLNGVRIKSWPDSQPGSATNMHFESVTMQNVSNPVIIDQQYCPNNQCNKQGAPSKVKVAKVSFKNIKGTSATPTTVTLLCSKGIPCEGVEVADIDLKYVGPPVPKENITTICDFVKPTTSGTLNPPMCATKPASS